MATVRQLAQGGYSIRVNDTELSLLRACVNDHDGHEDMTSVIDVMDNNQKRLMTEALGIRNDALDQLAKSLAEYSPEDNGE